MSIIEKKMIVHNKIGEGSWNRSSIVEFEGNLKEIVNQVIKSYDWLRKKNRTRKFECAQRTLKLVLLKVGVLNIITNKRLQD